MITRVECFKTRILEVGENPFDIKSMKVIKDFRCDRFRMTKRPLRMVADPFLFVKDDRLYLFFEQFYMNTKGVIAMTSTNDLVNWTDPVVVLEEPFHLSFPWVFRRNGNVYMIPETGGDKSIRLYVANNSLKSFKFVKKLDVNLNLSNKQEFDFWFGDTAIIEKDGVWYLFSTFGANGMNEMHLFMAEGFDGPYHEHPESPIYRSNKVGRNAGSLMEIDGRLIRVAQDCELGYGENIHVLEIDKLTRDSYHEKVVLENIIPREGFFKRGGHQFNSVEFRGRKIVSIDAKEYNLYLWNRILFKLGLYRDGR